MLPFHLFVYSNIPTCILSASSGKDKVLDFQFVFDFFSLQVSVDRERHCNKCQPRFDESFGKSKFSSLLHFAGSFRCCRYNFQRTVNVNQN